MNSVLIYSRTFHSRILFQESSCTFVRRLSENFWKFSMSCFLLSFSWVTRHSNSFSKNWASHFLNSLGFLCIPSLPSSPSFLALSGSSSLPVSEHINLSSLSMPLILGSSLKYGDILWISFTNSFVCDSFGTWGPREGLSCLFWVLTEQLGIDDPFSSSTEQTNCSVSFAQNRSGENMFPVEVFVSLALTVLALGKLNGNVFISLFSIQHGVDGGPNNRWKYRKKLENMIYTHKLKCK